MAPPSHHKKPARSLPIDAEDVFQYASFRILDSIGYPGAYRKFMLKRREQGADWALQMNSHVQGVQGALKELSLLEQDIKKSSVLKNLDIVWQHVVESNTPPSELHLTIGTCLITGKAHMPCIVIRGKGRGAHNFMVSSKFAPFLYHLWVIYKMDLLIKVPHTTLHAWSSSAYAVVCRSTPAGCWRRWTPLTRCHWQRSAKSSRRGSMRPRIWGAPCTRPMPTSTAPPRAGCWLSSEGYKMIYVPGLLFRIMLAQWLLCLWQARAMRAPWWTLPAIMLPMLCIETLLPDRRTGKHRAWPELLRAWVTLALIMHACLLLYGGLWNGGRALGPILLTVAAWGLRAPSKQSEPWWIEPAAMGGGGGGGGGAVCDAPGGGPPPVAGSGWLQLVLRLHMLMLANNSTTALQDEWVWYARPLLGLVGLCLVLTLCGGGDGQIDDSPWLLLALPAMCMHARRLVGRFIAPIVEGLITSPLSGPRTEALLRQQRQELLFYMMAWSVVISWGFGSVPGLLLGVLVAAGLMALRRQPSQQQPSHNNNNLFFRLNAP